jgi:general L-amino acid transport system substrate-binding protein
MMVAEELGITSQNAAEMKNSENPEIRRLLGAEELQGVSALGLSPEWAYNIITQVGNYGESFERHLGKSTKLGLSRGINALAKDGGLHYIPPIK